MAAPDFVSPHTAAQGDATSFAATKPSGVADGHLLIAQILTYVGLGADVSAAPSGWSLLEAARTWRVGNDSKVRIYYKIASGEPATWTWTHTGSTPFRYEISAWSGIHQASPINAFSGRSDPDDDPMLGTSITPSVDGCLILGIATLRDSVASQGPSDSLPAGYSTAYNLQDSRFAGYQACAYKVQAVAAATGALAFGLAAPSNNSVVHTIALAPESTPGVRVPQTMSYVS